MDVKIEPSWKQQLAEEFDKTYFQNLTQFVRQEYASGTCYPPGRLIFNAFDTTPFNDVRVVILGQDPYHGPGQAHGLCFSVNDGIAFPPSLQNIFKEVQAETGAPIPQSGNLTRWAKQGVFLLNTVLTVEDSHPRSHAGRGWETFTDHAILKINEKKEPVVFLLWGRDARNKAPMIDRSRHLVLEAAHPSPLSAYHGFFGCRHFSKANAFLKEHGQKEINWQVPDL
jgi:uracil-DNA glycosylase